MEHEPEASLPPGYLERPEIRRGIEWALERIKNGKTAPGRPPTSCTRRSLRWSENVRSPNASSQGEEGEGHERAPDDTVNET